MENSNQNQPPQPYYYNPAPLPPQPPYPAEKRELIFGVAIAIFSFLLCNFTLFGGFNLGVALAAIGCIVCTVSYLYVGGCRPDGYSATLLGLSILICAGFVRADDGFVKFVMVCFLLVTVNLALGLMAHQNRRDPAGFGSLLDPFRIALLLGLGDSTLALRGLGKAFREGGPAVKKGGSVLVGLVVAIPLLCILIPLLMSADAAFSGLLALLPDFQLGELIATLIFSTGAVCILYSRGVALVHKPKPNAAEIKTKTVSSLTVNTVLSAVCLVYLVYLLSQLAYFIGGFSGILPEGFTAAEYARRGFFEMAMLCFIDLGIIAFCVGLVAKKDGKAPLSTRLLCLFIGLVTIFLVITASAKMGLYISFYGLTRLRVLTELIMVFLGVTTGLVCLWLFAPKVPYMKVILLVALSMGAVTLWADVDTVVAAYNVSAYQSGSLATVDVDYLGTLGDGAVPYISQLTTDSYTNVASRAKEILAHRNTVTGDFRSWNYTSWLANSHAHH